MSRSAARPTHTADMTAADHRAKAAEAHQRSADSFDRCDTDGSVSQFANDLTGREHTAWAQLIDNGGTIEVPALFDAETGEIASTHQGFGDWGSYWVLRDAAAVKFGKRFWTASKAIKGSTRHRNDAKRGFVLGTVRVEGYVKIAGSGTGFSGLMSCSVVTVPSVDALRADRFEIVSRDDADYYGDEDR